MIGLFVIDQGLWVMDCDVEAHGGMGQASLTRFPFKAKQFADAGEALKYYRRQSTTRPLRHDGQPNRPLTAYTVELRRLP